MEGEKRAPLVRIERVTKRFGAFTAVDSLSLEIGAGEFFALLGPSGCGKTTLLRMLAGFETPETGRIVLDGRDITGMPPHLRPVNMMFQSYALFPHLSVAGNIAFGLRREGVSGAALKERVSEMLRLARLEGMEARKPHELSGGQRQRVALARALAKRPRLLLLDEPLAALDKKLREDTQFELKDIQRKLGLTFVIVTHDQDEAMSLAGRIGVMRRGQLVQVAPPSDIYMRPNSRYVAEFVGDINLIEGVAEEGGRVRLAGLGTTVTIEDRTAAIGAAVTLAVRPERISFDEGVNRLAASFVDSVFLGDVSHSRFRLANGGLIRVTRPNTGQRITLEPGASVSLTFSPDAAILLVE